MSSQPPSAAARTEPGPSHRLTSYLLRPAEIARSLRRRDLAPDVIAGLTVAAVAVPQAIAYASIAELPPQYGLATAAIGAIVGAIWGSSRHLATGPTNGVSLLLLPVLLAVADPGSPRYLIAAGTVAVMVGVLKIALAMMRFGAMVTLASRSVLVGFAAGAAIHIAVGQLKYLLRIDAPTAPELYNTAVAIASQIGNVHLTSLGLGLGTLAVAVVLGRMSARIPATLAAIVVAAALVAALGLDSQGVRVVGALPGGLPPPTWSSLDALPDLGLIRALGVGALAIAALGLVEAVASAQTIARSSGYRLDSNQEFFGQGMASIASGLLSGYPCSGSFTRSSLARQAGGRTQLTGVVTGATVLMAMLTLSPYTRYIPRAAIAGVLLAIAWGMVDRRAIRRILWTSRPEAAIMGVTFLATLTQPLDFAILAGILFSLAFFVIRSALPRVYQVVPDEMYRHLVRRPGAPVCPQLAIMNIRGPLFFGAVHHIEEELRHNLGDNPGQKILMLRMHGVDLIDLSGIEMLESVVTSYRGFGGDVYLVRLRQPVLDVMRSSGFLAKIGEDHILPQEGAIERLFNEVLEPAVCVYECEHRVFAECQALNKHPYQARVPTTARVRIEPERLLDVAEFQRLAALPDAVVLDVREPEEFEQGHLPGARPLPLRRVLEEGPQLPRDRRLLLACRSGRRTQRALHMLREMGFDEVYGLRGGILSWRAAGLPVAVGGAPNAAPPATARER